MNIAQVMQGSAKDYEATHILFDQSMFGVQVGDGVCHALCKVWLKKADALLPSDFHNEISTNTQRIILKQEKASAAHYDSNRLEPLDSVSIHLLGFANESDEFWEKCAVAMTPKRFNDHIKRIIKLNYGGTADHAVASHCDNQDNFRFFDPNGGIMDFGNSGDAFVNMQLWLENELPKATTSNYDKMQMIEVRRFTPKGQ